MNNNRNCNTGSGYNDIVSYSQTSGKWILFNNCGVALDKVVEYIIYLNQLSYFAAV